MINDVLESLYSSKYNNTVKKMITKKISNYSDHKINIFDSFTYEDLIGEAYLVYESKKDKLKFDKKYQLRSWFVTAMIYILNNKLKKCGRYYEKNIDEKNIVENTYISSTHTKSLINWIDSNDIRISVKVLDAQVFTSYYISGLTLKEIEIEYEIKYKEIRKILDTTIAKLKKEINEKYDEQY
jgi:RNA polymerase sigma factor (sigma-70 family)